MASEGKPETASIRLRRWAAIVWAVVAGLALLAKLTVDLPQAAPKWLRGLQSIPEYVFYLVLVIALFSAFFLLFRGLRTQQRLAERLEEEQATRQRLEAKLLPAPLPAPPEIVPQERVERLRELYASFWGRTVQLAHECLHVHICQVGEKGSQEQRRIAWLVQSHVVRPCSDDKYLLDVKFQSMTGPTTKADFGELLEMLSQVINNRYRETAFWILQAGESVLGKEALLSSSWYTTLYQRHQESLRELSRISARPDIGGISSWQRTLEELLPPPINPPQNQSVNPQPTTASGQSPPSLPESSE